MGQIRDFLVFALVASRTLLSAVSTLASKKGKGKPCAFVR